MLSITEKTGEKELIYRESGGELEIIEVTYVELKPSGNHVSHSEEGVQFTRQAPSGDTPSSRVAFFGQGKIYEPLYYKKGLAKAPLWLAFYPYYAFCAEHKTLYRTDRALGCFECSRKAKCYVVPVATSWE